MVDWSFKLGRVFGIPIKVHWLFLALLGFVMFFGGGPSAVVLVLCIFVCVALHELGHSLMARHYGVRVRDITLLPIGGVARLESVVPSPRAEFWISLAGPLVNVALVGLLVPVAIASGVGREALGWNLLGSFSVFVVTLMAINILMALFNLLPAFPMDGGRVFRAVLAKRRGMLAATHIAASVGRVMAVLMGIVGVVLKRPMLILIAFFVYGAGRREEFALRLQHQQASVLEADPYPGWRQPRQDAPWPTPGPAASQPFEDVHARQAPVDAEEEEAQAKQRQAAREIDETFRRLMGRFGR